MADLRDVNLNRLAIFVAVVDAGSLTAAAERLGLAKTVVSTHMQRLESEVGANLLVRTTRRLSVTDAGRAFYDACRDIVRAAESALDAVSSDAGPLRGTLRVSVPIDYGALVVAPAVVALRDRHPGLDVELVANDRVVDLVADNLDVAIRIGRLADSNYRAVQLGTYEKWLVASPAFVARHGRPQDPDALAALPFVMLSTLPRPHTVELEDEKGDTASVRCVAQVVSNTATACRAIVLAGGGFGLLTDFSTADDVAAGRLVRLLPTWRSAPAGIHAVYPSTRLPSPKVRAFVDAMKARIGETAGTRVDATRAPPTSS
ncbi:MULTISPECIES: LysR family transcriptional regulator [Burkholderia]|uniref:LysR family transcriptional regulator n=2 Tax=Burkholderia contaminans TaxID=488447 RepID=A0A1E3FVH5_9BURK|nr:MULTISPECIES: LysR family transcriptional regulator [Burkholderia]UTP24940.1 LysR family transcriptional regulator [Burkholderia sp. FXe9]KKL32504.1 LysR family transcriptional regulator [Burkholderia contaminans LMG 23361]MBA9829415.1 LysR family transcriptional regulator [Burkholderia contaminans]MBA9835823.1 LysR family transcriptional regulator [Burkholderia contaminans]MBA9861369.1 LysR family transcriptional regulator [Burkholderia contaminans]